MESGGGRRPREGPKDGSRVESEEEHSGMQEPRKETPRPLKPVREKTGLSCTC